ncbi:uncharacterized protein BYT42DRAFT_640945 [Radiomyces spectabilis]|uniref:uncharacterized protein n=1 Tax=Radiomyces spectabilis TaxID=64574 RepID=UPI00221F4267|nr:uncharacterized protein BYT42DRAFT_640945 [Radiomyces spectabilis]KAI8393823.1 hypothetical protein BYT42DRAFT_640945 [Radiomyces spectabilis]
MSNNADLLKRIAELSGAIEQHRMNQPDHGPTYSPTSYRGRPWTRGRGRGNMTLNNTTPHPAKGSPNRTLIVNQSQAKPFSATPSHSATSSSAVVHTHHRKLDNTKPSVSPSAVKLPSAVPGPTGYASSVPAKRPFGTSQHRTLINNYGASTITSIPPAAAAATATASTAQRPIHRPLHRPNVSHNKTLLFNKSSSGIPGVGVPTTVSRSINAAGQETVTVNGVSYIDKGNKLVRQGHVGSTPAPRVLVKRLSKSNKYNNMVLGKRPRIRTEKKRHVRSKKGNMVLMREPEGYTRQGRSGKSLVLNTKKMQKQYCGFYTRYGKCPNGPSCLFKHDPARRAICPRFLNKRCKKPAGQCKLSHTPTPNIMPHCVHFQRGRCSNDDCPYPHVRVSPDAPICRAFATEGYCPKGLECPQKHVHVCPEFAETSKCSNANCRLPHVTRRTGDQQKATGIVRPGSWVSAHYFHAQKQARAEQQKERAAKRQRMSVRFNHVTGKPETDQDDDDTKEENEEDGFVRLFDNSDDEGWSQFYAKESTDTDDESEEEKNEDQISSTQQASNGEGFVRLHNDSGDQASAQFSTNDPKEQELGELRFSDKGEDEDDGEEDEDDESEEEDDSEDDEAEEGKEVESAQAHMEQDEKSLESDKTADALADEADTDNEYEEVYEAVSDDSEYEDAVGDITYS